MTRVLFCALPCILAMILSGHPGSESPAPLPLPETTAPSVSESAAPDSDANSLLITVGEQTFSAQLHSNPTAQAFAEQLPLTLSMEELNGNEKFYYLAQPLPADAQHLGEVRAGELMLYGTDCLVLFYQDLPTAHSYTRLGWIADASGLADALGHSSAQVTFTAG